MKIIHTAIALLAWLLVPYSAHSATLPGLPEFIDEMVANTVQARRTGKPVCACAASSGGDRRISRPATTRPWLEYARLS